PDRSIRAASLAKLVAVSGARVGGTWAPYWATSGTGRGLTLECSSEEGNAWASGAIAKRVGRRQRNGHPAPKEGSASTTSCSTAESSPAAHRRPLTNRSEIKTLLLTRTGHQD